VEAVVGEGDRAPDRATGVVDEDTDVRVVGEDPGAEIVDRIGIGEVGGVGAGGATQVLDLVPGLLELLGPRARRGCVRRRPGRS
jgi:hypothetical protein